LWPTYFAAILFGYQLLRSIEGVLLNRPIRLGNFAFLKLNVRAVKKQVLKDKTLETREALTA
jgi:hypothetical protein